jgi:hypothetical protein
MGLASGLGPDSPCGTGDEHDSAGQLQPLWGAEHATGQRHCACSGYPDGTERMSTVLDHGLPAYPAQFVKAVRTGESTFHAAGDSAKTATERAVLSSVAPLDYFCFVGALRHHSPMSLAMIIFITSLVPP